MKLITKEIREKLKRRPIGSQDGKGNDADIIVKFFNPCGAGTWYVIEGDELPNGDFEFFGLVELFEREYCYFTLSQLTSLKLPFGMKIERDLYFKNKKIGDIK